ncbi:hypothetical protein Nepgr_010570 [Nepenthes gracilis]|uniref:Histone-lysine N-methyltransferase ASHH3 n=1 Tax=Nepenthes gracilis TaxID=150966 RepID=A0AAD3XLG0_NEPGR|nr:hypothetical protein Nepgr_010570 [Nepenthes gracilis]
MPATKKCSECSSFGNIFDMLVKQLGNPVEFELPDWLNKWKPTSYTFIKRNIYLTKKIKRRHEDDGIFCSCNPSPGSNTVCARDCHCGMLLSSCSSGCKCGTSCVNKPFQNRAVKKMKLVQTEKCGSGVVADEDIDRGEFVIEYVGEVIDDKRCEERLWKMKHHGETNFYLCEINRDMVIDATYKGNKSRYINHSCCPNTQMQKWSIDGETRIGIFATRDIKRGEHLTYDYQFVQFGADQDCHCGAAGCRQKLGARPNKPRTPSSDAALKFVANQMAVSSPKVKAILSGKNVYQNGDLHGGSATCQTTCCHNCIGEVVMINRPVRSARLFGIIKQFDSVSKRHLIIRLGICDFMMYFGCYHLKPLVVGVCCFGLPRRDESSTSQANPIGSGEEYDGQSRVHSNVCTVVFFHVLLLYFCNVVVVSLSFASSFAPPPTPSPKKKKKPNIIELVGISH